MGLQDVMMGLVPTLAADDAALNYDERDDDGSCIYEGCTYNLACNTTPLLAWTTVHGLGTCQGAPPATSIPHSLKMRVLHLWGVYANPLACNYDEEALQMTVVRIHYATLN